MVNSYDVARRVGVSQTTVSRALRGHPSVLPETRAAIVAAATELGYVVNSSARSLATRRTNSVALVVADVDNLYYHELIQLMHRALTRRGQRMLIVRDSVSSDGSEALDHLDVDGVILASAAQGSATARGPAARGLPLVLFNRDAPGLDADLLLPDDVAGCELVAGHLTDLGHRRIGMITGTPDTTSGRQRADAFRSALANRGIALPDGLFSFGRLEHASGSDLGTAMLTGCRPPTAIFCGSDTLAFGVLDAAAALGLSVPDDVSVVGFDDLKPASWRMIGLTTVRQPLAQMVDDAVDILHDRIELQDTAPQHRTYPVELVVRSTTGPVSQSAHDRSLR